MFFCDRPPRADAESVTQVLPTVAIYCSTTRAGGEIHRSYRQEAGQKYQNSKQIRFRSFPHSQVFFSIVVCSVGSLCMAIPAETGIDNPENNARELRSDAIGEQTKGLSTSS